MILSEKMQEWVQNVICLLLLSHVWPNCQDVRDCWGWGRIFHFILDIRDCSISSNLSHFLLELIPGRPGTTIILRKLDCGEQSKIAKTLPIILQKYRCQPAAEVRFIYISPFGENVISKFTLSFIRILVADKMV